MEGQQDALLELEPDVKESHAFVELSGERTSNLLALSERPCAATDTVGKGVSTLMGLLVFRDQTHIRKRPHYRGSRARADRLSMFDRASPKDALPGRLEVRRAAYQDLRLA